MAQRTMYLDKFHSRVEHFWKAERYTDVTIECGEKNFKCHRLVLAATCEYFDVMFGGKFRERNADNIPLSGISPDTLEQVLKFIYTGDVSIDTENVCALLQASEFFKLPDVEDLCIRFVEENGVTVQDTLDIFRFACATKKQLLIDALSVHIANHFDMFLEADSFLEIPFDDLKTILIRFTWSSLRNEDKLLSAIICWMNYDREARLQHFSEFVKMIRFENISSTYIQFMFTKFLLDPHDTARTQTLKPTGYSNDSLLQGGATSETKTSLHIFGTSREGKCMKVFSINREQVCSVSNWIPWTNFFYSIRNVALNNSYLYSLHYPYCPLKFKDLSFHELKFSAYTSVSSPLALRLKPPPVNFYFPSTGFTDLCAIENNIFAIYPCESCIVNRTNSLYLFDTEEINRGICVYNCEVDNWFPVPKMKRKMKTRCITAENNFLYLFGETDSEGCAQMYDRRIGTWQELTKTEKTHKFTACCSMSGKLYIHLGEKVSEIERYDPAAGRWEKLSGNSTSPNMRWAPSYMYCRLIPFSDKLWLIGQKTPPRASTTTLFIDILSIDSCTWRTSSFAIDDICNKFGFHVNLDAVVFKSN